MKNPRTYSPLTVEAARLLGARIRAARRERRWTVDELAERVGVTHPTIRKIERGDLTVSLGSAFEAAALLGIPLFGDDPDRRSIEAGRLEDRLAVLPRRVRRPVKVDNDF
jgi:transcriptional regulator with XRE-family HTH domain